MYRWSLSLCHDCSATWEKLFKLMFLQKDQQNESLYGLWLHLEEIQKLISSENFVNCNTAKRNTVFKNSQCKAHQQRLFIYLCCDKSQHSWHTFCIFFIHYLGKERKDQRIMHCVTTKEMESTPPFTVAHREAIRSISSMSMCENT